MEAYGSLSYCPVHSYAFNLNLFGLTATACAPRRARRCGAAGPLPAVASPVPGIFAKQRRKYSRLSVPRHCVLSVRKSFRPQTVAYRITNARRSGPDNRRWRLKGFLLLPSASCTIEGPQFARVSCVLLLVRHSRPPLLSGVGGQSVRVCRFWECRLAAVVPWFCPCSRRVATF